MSRQKPTYFFKPKGHQQQYKILGEVGKDSAHYHTHSTYHYPWIRQEETELRACYFERHDYMKLSNKKLDIYEDRKYHSFPIEEIQGLEGGMKKFIGPLVIGGIVAPLSIIALFSDYFNFWIGLGLAVTGLLLFYYGYQGGYQVTVKSPHKNFQFFVDEEYPQIRSFIGWANRYLRQK